MACLVFFFGNLLRGVQTKCDKCKYNHLRLLYHTAWSFWTIRFIRVFLTCHAWRSGGKTWCLPTHFWISISQPQLLQPYMREVTSSAWTCRWLDVAAWCRLKSLIFSTLFALLQTHHLRCPRCSGCFRRFIRAALDTPFAPPPPELHVIAPFTLIFNVELQLNSCIWHLVWTPLYCFFFFYPFTISPPLSSTA